MIEYCSSNRLRYLVDINCRALPESTPEDSEIEYLDISAVGTGCLVSEPASMRFGDAPSRARRLVRDGDTIISTVRTYLRAVWPVNGSTSKLVVSTGFAVLTPKLAIDPRYLGWVCQSSSFIDEVVARSNGVSYPAINAPDIGEIRVRLPTLSEQAAIADYLDAETARFDALIAKKQRMMELLEERALAHLAKIFGTKLEYDAAGRPIGVGGFMCIRLGALAEIQSGLTLDGGRRLEGDEVDLPYLRVANVQDGSITLDEIKRVVVTSSLAARCTLQSGDVLMTEGGDPDKLGRGAVWSGEISPCLHQNHVFAIRTGSKLLPEFLALVTRTPYARVYFEMTASKTTGIASTSTTKISSFRVPLPLLEEQRAILKAIGEAMEIMDALKISISEQLMLLKEHRQALITAAVTGQLDIPEAVYGNH